MAKRRRRRSRKRRGTGSVIRVRRMRGLGQLNNPSSMTGSFWPPMIGGGAAAVTTIGIRQFVRPTTEWMQQLQEYAPWVGLAVGSLAAWGLGTMNKRATGWSAAAGAGAVTLGTVMMEMAAKANFGTDGLGAIVPEYGNMGAIVMEPQASRGYGAGALGNRAGVGGDYGEVVNLGNINTSAFGTPGFQIS